MFSPAPFKLATLTVAIAAGICTTNIQAADTDSEISTLVVYGGTYRNTASKSALDPEETPQGITILDREHLDKRAADSINKALRYAPAVNTELRGGSVTRMDQFNIRGFSNDVNFYDGLPLQYNDWNLQPQIDAATLEQIEIFKGPTSVLYGSMPPGGMVNIIAKQPSAESKNSVEVSTGTQKLRRASISSQGKLADSEQLSYTLTAVAKHQDGQAVTSKEKRYALATAVNMQVTEDTLVNFNLYHQQDPAAGIYNAHPSAGTVFSNINGQLPTDSYAGDANWNTYDRDVTLIGYKISHNINDDWSFLQNVKYMDAEVLQKNTYSTSLDADQRTLNRRAYLTDESSSSFAMDNQLSGKITVGKLEHNVLIGADVAKLNSKIKYEDVATASIDLFNPNHHLIDPNMDISNSVYSSDFTITKKQVGVYLQDQIRIDNLVLIAGGRYDNFKSTEKGKKYNATVDTELKQHQFSGRIGALYTFNNGISPFASYAQSFEPVSGSDKNGNAFVPATADQIEIGLKYSPLENDTAITVSAFRIVKDKNITRDPDGGAYDKIQAGEITSQGIELAISTALSTNLSMDFNATLMDMEFTKDSDLQGKTPIWVAEESASLWLNYDLPNALLADSQMGLGVRYVGKTQLDTQNSGTVPGYTLVDLSFSTELGNMNKNLTGANFNLSVNNLFDKRYGSCYDANNCWFGAARSIEAKLKFPF
ncbi:MAG: TonB-dependent siderophore receptor [Pseudomonadales bacterium]|nr:TonB-dependent siderophore receptor [Pseudomonadales bacterium]NRA16262.1 TonB-dependent siderophore receptor [Oceanospirillaceae bacterium]